jgi:hypothetical protein
VWHSRGNDGATREGEQIMNIEVILDIILQILTVIETIARILGLKLNLFGG